MAHYRLRPRAQRDIEEIWDYSSSAWGALQAETYIRQIQRSLEILAADPQLGRKCDNLRPGYRKYPVGSHLVFYRIVENSIDIVRILHRRMDFERHL